MKKFILSAALIAAIGFTAAAADGGKKYDDSKNVSYFVINQFNADFSGAENVNWTVTSTTQKADFTVDGVKKTAFYSLTGSYLGFTEAVAYKKLPASAQKEISSEYSDYKAVQVIKFTSNNTEDAAFRSAYNFDSSESVNYFVDLKKSDAEVLVRVSANGSVFFFKQIK